MHSAGDKIAKKRKLLFFSEAVTLAHVARPIVLAQALDAAQFDVHFAWDDRYKNLFSDVGFTFHALSSISCGRFLNALAKGDPVYDADTLIAYVKQDLRIIKDVNPDCIVGDFRISLAISAKLAGVPYVTITNAYWSPHITREYHIAEHPMVDLLGITVAQQIFTLLRPIIFAIHCLPMNKARKYFGLKSLGFDLKRIYTHADYTLYADIPELYPASDLPTNHQFIGPVLWSPDIVEPEWWEQLPTDKTVVYCTFGSSGAVNLMALMLDVLSCLPVTVIAITAGRANIESKYENVYLADFLAGDKACEIADLVICNGGSPSTQQALMHGVPVLGIVSNMDQHLNMDTLVEAGAGKLLRSGKVDVTSFRSAVEQMLGDPNYTQTALELAGLFNRYQSAKNFSTIIENICSRT